MCQEVMTEHILEPPLNDRRYSSYICCSYQNQGRKWQQGRVALAVRVRPDAYTVKQERAKIQNDEWGELTGRFGFGTVQMGAGPSEDKHGVRVDPEFPNSELEWTVDDIHEGVVLTGLLVKVEDIDGAETPDPASDTDTWITD